MKRRGWMEADGLRRVQGRGWVHDRSTVLSVHGHWPLGRHPPVPTRADRPRRERPSERPLHHSVPGGRADSNPAHDGRAVTVVRWGISPPWSGAGSLALGGHEACPALPRARRPSPARGASPTRRSGPAAQAGRRATAKRPPESHLQRGAPIARRSYRRMTTRRVSWKPPACILTKYVPLGIGPASRVAR